MPKVLMNIDERTRENLMEGPWVNIEEPSYGYAKRTAAFNKAGFEKYAHLVDEYDCEGFAIAIEDIAENKLQAYFAPDLGRIRKKDAILEIDISGSGAFAENFDLEVFKEFTNVKAITTQNVPFYSRLPDLFPKVETWLNLDWKANKIKALDGKWPRLTNLSLQGFSGSLSIFDGAPISKLFLISSTIKDIADVLRFENIEVLQFVSCRIAGDVSALANLKKLRSLRFAGKSKLEGWETLKSATVENFEASHYPVKFPKDGFPRLKNYVINAYRSRDPHYEEGGDVARLSDDFSSIFN